MGLRLRLGGDADYEWTRAITPARGTVTLTAGHNLVSWAGADDVPIDEAVRGVGSALISARLGDGSHRNLNRGDALWVEVARNVRWLQPTNVLPVLEFPGGAPESLKDEIRDELRSVIHYYSVTFGVQADFATYRVLMARSADGLIAYCSAASCSSPPEILRELWNFAGGWWDGQAAVVKQRYFGCQFCRKNVLSHEYFHVLQTNLTGRGIPGVAWTTEGIADWSDTNHALADGHFDSFEHSRRQAKEVAAKGPTLKEVEVNIGTWHYTLGKLATDQLVERAGQDSPLEFYRLLTQQSSGTNGRWASRIGWQGAFKLAFGITVGEFYEQFDSWQNALPDRKVWVGTGDGDRRLRGRLIRSDGTPIVGARIIAGLGGDDASVTHDYGESVTRTQPDGTFELAVSSDRRYRLRVQLAESHESHRRCTVYWQRSGVTWDDWGAEWISIGSQDPAHIEFVVPDDWCMRRISGRIVDVEGHGIEGLQVVAGSKLTPHEDNGPRVLSQLDGSFEIVVPRAVEYRVTVRTENLGGATGCEIHYSRSGATSSRDRASNVNVIDGDAAGVIIALHEDMCLWKVTGVLLDAADEGIGGATVRLQTDETIVSFPTDSSGGFELTVPEPGEWFISLKLGACHLYYANGTTVTSNQQASRLMLDRDIQWLPISVSPLRCNTPVAGRVLYADGTAARSLQMFVGSAWFLTEKDGGFSGTLAEPGPQLVNLWTKEGCLLYRTAGGWSPRNQDWVAIDIPAGGATHLEFRLPENPSSLCN